MPRRVGEFMLDRLRGWERTHPLVGEVRGRGLMIGIEIVKDKATREPAVALRNRIETMAFERGLMVLGCGETSLRLSPPLIVSEAEATVALDILEDALKQVEEEHEQAARALAAATGHEQKDGRLRCPLKPAKNPMLSARYLILSSRRMLAISEVRCAARSRFWAISWVARCCSSAAAAI